MSCVLSTLADISTPTNDQVKVYKSVLNHVVNILHKSSYRIGRIKAGGSFGKDTGIPNRMDLDITFFLNDYEPPFGECLDEIRDLIESELDVENIRSCKRSITFFIYCDDLDESLKVDLLPAPNYVVDTKNVDDICVEQQQQTLAVMRMFDDPRQCNKDFASSFTEASVEFIQSVSTDIRQLVRLAKLWKDSVYFDGYVSGLASTVETIAVYAGIMYMRSCGGCFYSMQDAFGEFLRAMESIGTARIIFSHDEMDEDECLTFYNEGDIDGRILCQVPLVLDPANPYNNRLGNNKSHKMFVEILSQKARESLEAMSAAYNCYGVDLAFELLRVLCPGPFDACFQNDVSGVMETPEKMAMTTMWAPKIKESKLTQRVPLYGEQEKWAEFLLHHCDRLVCIAQELDLDCVEVLKDFFVNAAKKDFHKLRRKRDYYQHILRIPIGSGEVMNIFIRWMDDEEYD